MWQTIFAHWLLSSKECTHRKAISYRVCLADEESTWATSKIMFIEGWLFFFSLSNKANVHARHKDNNKNNISKYSWVHVFKQFSSIHISRWHAVFQPLMCFWCIFYVFINILYYCDEKTGFCAYATHTIDQHTHTQSAWFVVFQLTPCISSSCWFYYAKKTSS